MHTIKWPLPLAPSTFSVSHMHTPARAHTPEPVRTAVMTVEEGSEVCWPCGDPAPSSALMHAAVKGEASSLCRNCAQSRRMRSSGVKPDRTHTNRTHATRIKNSTILTGEGTGTASPPSALHDRQTKEWDANTHVWTGNKSTESAAARTHDVSAGGRDVVKQAVRAEFVEEHGRTG